MDLILQRLGHWRGWWRSLLLAVGLSVAFMALFVPTQWYFSKFLLTPAADNWFFVGNRYWWYFAHPGDHWHRFWDNETMVARIGLPQKRWRWASCMPSFPRGSGWLLAVGWRT